MIFQILLVPYRFYSVHFFPYEHASATAVVPYFEVLEHGRQPANAAGNLLINVPDKALAEPRTHQPLPFPQRTAKSKVARLPPAKSGGRLLSLAALCVRRFAVVSTCHGDVQREGILLRADFFEDRFHFADCVAKVL